MMQSALELDTSLPDEEYTYQVHDFLDRVGTDMYESGDFDDSEISDVQQHILNIYGNKESANRAQEAVRGEMFGEKEKDFTLGPKQARYDAEGNLIVERAAEGETGSEFAPDIETYINNETGESIDINVRDQKAIDLAKQKGFEPISPETRGYGVAIGKASAEREAAINADSAKARSQITTLDAMDQLLDRFETGKLSKVGMTVQQYANAIGLPVDVKELGDKEAFNAIAEQLALQSRNMGEGMVLAGQMSDRDVQFLRDMNAQLVISKGGNKKIIRMRKKIAKRNNEVASLMRKFKKENKGRFDATAFDGYLEKNFGKSSIFGIPSGSQLLGNDKITGLPVYETPDGKTIIPDF
jgi:hypothetical protein